MATWRKYRNFSLVIGSHHKMNLTTHSTRATLKGHTTIAALLLSNGAHITQQTFLAATRNKDLPIFQEVLNHGWTSTTFHVFLAIWDALDL